MVTAEFSKFVYILSAALSQHHPLGFEIATGIPSPPLTLFIVMLRKAHLTSHSRMCGSRWVIIPSWLSEEALKTAEKREVKGKGEKERYTHLNAEFQRIARRDKKAFLSDQCKEIEENNRMGKTRDLFKKIRDTKGTFHAKMIR